MSYNSGLTKADVSGSITQVTEKKPTGSFRAAAAGAISGAQVPTGKVWHIKGTLSSPSSSASLYTFIGSTTYIAAVTNGSTTFDIWLPAAAQLTLNGTGSVFIDYWEEDA